MQIKDHAQLNGQLSEYLSRLEKDIEIPPHGRAISPVQEIWMKVLEKMEIKKSSVVITPEEVYNFERSSNRLGYSICRRSLDDRGIKKWRYWVLSHEPNMSRKLQNAVS